MVTQQQGSDDARRGDSRAATPVIRFILLAVLVLAIVALIVDRRARQQARAAYDGIQSRLDSEERRAQTGAAGSASDVISPSVVRTITGREPLRIETRPNRIIERYGWRGALRMYYVVATFQPGSVAYLVGVQFTTDPEGGYQAEQEPALPPREEPPPQEGLADENPAGQ